MVPDGFTSTGRAAVASIGTHTSNKIHGMRGSHTSVSTIAMTIQSSSERFLNHPTWSDFLVHYPFSAMGIRK